MFAHCVYTKTRAQESDDGHSHVQRNRMSVVLQLVGSRAEGRKIHKIRAIRGLMSVGREGQ